MEGTGCFYKNGCWVQGTVLDGLYHPRGGGWDKTGQTCVLHSPFCVRCQLEMEKGSTQRQCIWKFNTHLLEEERICSDFIEEHEVWQTL